MNEKLLKPYSPKETEDRIYKLWEESGFFNPDICVREGVATHDAEPYSIVLPPPNVTGTLHMGHAAMLAIEDILIRFNRMRGKRTLWLPGTDHAAIATQSVVEKELYKQEGKTRHDLGRDAFLKRVDAFALASHDTIVHQLRKMGSSLDWSREAFTLDEARSRSVRTVFKRMYDDGLIERGLRVVNWDPKGQTVISDDEIVYEERPAKLYTFRYSKDFPVNISTTRPETKVGDTAVAVHPGDARYKPYVGKTFEVDFAGTHLSIRVIADASVDMAYGTGALGVTPAHSVIDSDIAERHGLSYRGVINEYARMTKDAGPLVAELKTKEAREKIISWLKENDLLEKEEDVLQNVGTAERTGGIIEPLPKLQWFVKVNKKIPGKSGTLKDIMSEAVSSGAIRIVPEHFEKTYFHWVENLRDWCISRQIWYGHRIPVYYCDNAQSQSAGRRTKVTSSDDEAPIRTVGQSERSNDACKHPIASIEEPAKCPHCGGPVVQDPDTLDTWFSSGLWTFSTLGWPVFAANATSGKPGPENDLANYHPTSVLETGYDILFFWVARMILMTGYVLGDIPFKTVYLHGLVRDKEGRKMSKSLKNAIDPLAMIEKYGADATRLSLIVGNTPGQDIRLSEDKIRGYKNFANKLWNIARFVFTNTENFDASSKPRLSDADAVLVENCTAVAGDVTVDIEQYRLYLAAEKLYHYMWHTFADIVIEESKERLKSDDDAVRKSAQYMLYFIFTTMVKLLHPFMPFITEELWSLVRQRNEGKNGGLLMVERWPV